MNFSWIDSVTHIVTLTVGNVGDEVHILAFFTMFNVDLSNGNNAIEPKVESVAQISNEDYLSDADVMSYSDEFMAKDQHGIIAKHKELKEAEAKQHTPITKDREPGRNDPCPCGSGKKYKKCCGV